MNSSQFNKILVVKHGSLGDIAFSILAMASIKQFFSNATIDLLTEEKYAKFLSNSNYFNSIFTDNRKEIFVGVLIFSAIITPTGDPVTLFIFTIPLYMLIELVLYLSKNN